MGTPSAHAQKEIGDRGAEVVVNMKDWYNINQAPSRRQGSTKDMIKKPKKAPEFKAQGAETRYLAPFRLDLAMGDACELPN